MNFNLTERKTRYVLCRLMYLFSAPTLQRKANFKRLLVNNVALANMVHTGLIWRACAAV